MSHGRRLHCFSRIKLRQFRRQHHCMLFHTFWCWLLPNGGPLAVKKSSSLSAAGHRPHMASEEHAMAAVTTRHKWTAVTTPHGWTAITIPHRWATVTIPHGWTAITIPHGWTAITIPHGWTAVTIHLLAIQQVPHYWLVPTWVQGSCHSSELDASELRNYRPVSNLTFLSKLLEKVLQVHITGLFWQSWLTLKTQSTHLQFHCCETAVILVVDVGRMSAFWLLDLTAAFDTVITT